MSLAPERVKQSTETRTLSFDFLGDGYGASNCKLKTNDTVASVNGVTADTGLVVGAPSLLTSVVTVQVSSGVAGTRYWVSCNVTTTDGDILELDCYVVVDDHQN